MIKKYNNAYSSNFEIEIPTQDSFIFKNIPHVRKISWGGLYDENGDCINSSIRRGIYGGDRVISLAPCYYSPSKDDTDTIKGKSLYLGPLMGHYGHFLIETLSRINILDLEEFDNIIFTKFIWGSKLPSFSTDFLNFFNANTDRILVIEKETKFEWLYVTEQLWDINRKPNLLVKDVYSHIRENILSKKSDRVFLTYSNKMKSRIRNLDKVELIFKKYNFKIVEPEKLSITKQLEIYKNTNILAGTSGTVMHNCLFCRDNNFIIEIGDSRSPTDYIPIQQEINALNSLDSHRINFKGKDNEIDLFMLEEELLKILDLKKEQK